MIPPPPTRRQPEKQIQADIVKLLRSIGAAIYVLGHPSPNDGRTHRGTGQTSGVPDIYAFLDGTPTRKGVGVWIEVKAPRGRLSWPQQCFSAECRVRDIPYITGGLDAVIAYLQAGGWLK